MENQPGSSAAQHAVADAPQTACSSQEQLGAESESEERRLERQHAFLDAAKAFDFHAVREMATATPALINVQPCGRWSALHQAYAADDVGMVHWLLERGADASARSGDGHRPDEVAPPPSLEKQPTLRPAGNRTPTPPPCPPFIPPPSSISHGSGMPPISHGSGMPPISLGDLPSTLPRSGWPPPLGRPPYMPPVPSSLPLDPAVMATMAPAPPTSMVSMPMPVPPASPGPLSSRAPAVLPAGAVGAAVQPGGGGASSLSVSCSLGIAGGGNGNEVGGGNGNGVGSDSAHPTRWGPPQPLSDAVVAAGIPPSDGAVLSRSTFADDALRSAGLYSFREGSATLAAKHEPSRQDPSKQGDDSQVSRVNSLLLRTNSQLQRQITTLQRENHTLKWQMQTSTLQQANETLQQQNSILVAETSALQGQTAEMRWRLSEQETALRFMQARLSSGRWSELTPGAISFESSVFRRLYDTTTAPRRARVIRRCLSCMLRSFVGSDLAEDIFVSMIACGRCRGGKCNL